eukprot:5257-Chlamydomonas_euryale.AAC.2
MGLCGRCGPGCGVGSDAGQWRPFVTPAGDAGLRRGRVTRACDRDAIDPRVCRRHVYFCAAPPPGPPPRCCRNQGPMLALAVLTLCALYDTKACGVGPHTSVGGRGEWHQGFGGVGGWILTLCAMYGTNACWVRRHTRRVGGKDRGLTAGGGTCVCGWVWGGKTEEDNTSVVMAGAVTRAWHAQVA